MENLHRRSCPFVPAYRQTVHSSQLGPRLRLDGRMEALPWHLCKCKYSTYTNSSNTANCVSLPGPLTGMPGRLLPIKTSHAIDGENNVLHCVPTLHCELGLVRRRVAAAAPTTASNGKRKRTRKKRWQHLIVRRST